MDFGGNARRSVTGDITITSVHVIVSLPSYKPASTVCRRGVGLVWRNVVGFAVDLRRSAASSRDTSCTASREFAPGVRSVESGVCRLSDLVPFAGDTPKEHRLRSPLQS